ncbi:TlpA disulfide reductase family protein [Pedobacter frigoris]|uniref:TlpA family protein disulfide reductase n=1 Tax=Pedobacter frigoris TaxID=2571272 RepID=A0A4U1CNT5_9SPHI|nr:TlpA disulfide reductase family protein [Pedobacter frigoris]TKC07044.1 TlpA family protein disulfide reductase [Pedobacter frigoris]
MFKNSITILAITLCLAGAALAQDVKPDKEAAAAWMASIKDLTVEEAKIYAALKNATDDEAEKLELQIKDIAAKKLERKAAYISKYPNSDFSLSLVNDELIFLGNYEDGNLLYSKLGKAAKSKPAAKKIEERLAVLKHSAIGEQMPDFTQPDTEGKPVKLSDFKGKYVLVDFWASWCHPCRAENPNVLKAYGQYKDKGFTVLGISLDDKAERWKKAIEEDQMPWTQVSDLKGFKNEVSSYYGINAIPSTLLIDPRGKIIAKDLRGKALHRKLEELLGSVTDAKSLNDSISKLKRPERLKWIEGYAAQNPGSPSGPYFLSEFLKFDYQTTMEQQEAIMDKFKGAAKATPEYVSMAKDLESKKKLLPGYMAPDFTLLKPDGKPLTLSAMRGKYVLIDFWASWCVPCRKAIPHLKEVYAKYKAKGFEILSLSGDQNQEAWRKAMDQEQMPWPQVCDDFPEKFKPSRVGGIYQTRFIPFYVLLDPKGKILVYSGQESDVEKELERIFSK